MKAIKVGMYGGMKYDRDILPDMQEAHAINFGNKGRDNLYLPEMRVSAEYKFVRCDREFRELKEDFNGRMVGRC